MVLRWQFSQTVEVGKCAAPVFVGVVGGILTTTGLPSKAPTLLPWHSAQLVLMPLWLNCAPAKLVQVVMVLAAVWHDSQPRLRMGMCTGAVVLGVLMPPTVVMVEAYLAALAVLWHWTQLPVLDWILAWIAALVGATPQLVWQESQFFAVLYGMCAAGNVGWPK